MASTTSASTPRSTPPSMPSPRRSPVVGPRPSRRVPRLSLVPTSLSFTEDVENELGKLMTSGSPRSATRFRVTTDNHPDSLPPSPRRPARALQESGNKMMAPVWEELDEGSEDEGVQHGTTAKEQERRHEAGEEPVSPRVFKSSSQTIGYTPGSPLRPAHSLKEMGGLLDESIIEEDEEDIADDAEFHLDYSEIAREKRPGLVQECGRHICSQKGHFGGRPVVKQDGSHNIVQEGTFGIGQEDSKVGAGNQNKEKSADPPRLPMGMRWLETRYADRRGSSILPVDNDGESSPTHKLRMRGMLLRMRDDIPAASGGPPALNHAFTVSKEQGSSAKAKAVRGGPTLEHPMVKAATGLTRAAPRADAPTALEPLRSASWRQLHSAETDF
ncbi:predicted protein [Postia placenta Mad-698-R]|nr:predicted protein [Postia placenta Mad-698-R]